MRDYATYTVTSADTQAHILYQAVLQRLLDDVAMPMQYYRSTGHGNWSSIRMMAPVIEALAKSSTSKRNSILKDIGVLYPSIFWAMYRHGLMHNDSQPQSIQLDDHAIGWGFNWTQIEATRIVGSIYIINPSVIFDNLVHWLRSELKDISRLSEVTVEEAMSVIIRPEKNSQLKTEFEEIVDEQSV